MAKTEAFLVVTGVSHTKANYLARWL